MTTETDRVRMEDGEVDRLLGQVSSPRDERRGLLMKYRLPRAFIFDHLSRDRLPVSTITKTTARYVECDLTAEQAEELLHDAEHYADPINAYSADMPGLVRSARATVRALNKAGVT